MSRVVRLQASSRCGTPDELKAMIDEAHHLGLTARPCPALLHVFRGDCTLTDCMHAFKYNMDAFTTSSGIKVYCSTRSNDC